MTTSKVLHRTFPKAFTTEVYNQSSTLSASRSYPESLLDWDLIDDVQMLSIDASFPKADWKSTSSFQNVQHFQLECNTEVSVHHLFARIIGEFVNNILGRNELKPPEAIPESLRVDDDCPRRAPHYSKINSDFAFCDRWGIYAPVEIKPVDGQVEEELSISNDVTYDEAYEQFKSGESTHFNHAARAVAQLYGYMLDCGSKFGMISTYNKTWFVMETAENVLSISRPIEITDTNPYLLQAIFVFMFLAKTDQSVLNPTSNRRLSDVVRAPRISSSQEADDDDDHNEDEVSEYLPSDGEEDASSNTLETSRSSSSGGVSSTTGNNGAENSSSSSTCSSDANVHTACGVPPFGSPPSSDSDKSGGKNFKPTTLKRKRDTDGSTSDRCNKSKSHGWSDVQIYGKIGSGRSADVHLCSDEGTMRALKLFNLAEGDAQQELQHELFMYDSLKRCQGRFVPSIHKPDIVSPSGTVAGFTMDLGTPLPATYKEWTTEQKHSAETVLWYLADQFEVVQTDIRPENFICGNDGGVQVIDLVGLVKEKDKDVRFGALKRFERELYA